MPVNFPVFILQNGCITVHLIQSKMNLIMALYITVSRRSLISCNVHRVGQGYCSAGVVASPPLSLWVRNAGRLFRLVELEGPEYVTGWSPHIDFTTTFLTAAVLPRWNHDNQLLSHSWQYRHCRWYHE